MEFYGSHEEEVPVTQVLFLPGLGRLVTLTENNSLHLWETQGTQLVRLKSTHLDGRLKQFTQLCLDSEKRIVHLGTEGGNIYRLNLWTFEIDETIVYQASRTLPFLGRYLTLVTQHSVPDSLCDICSFLIFF